jgi:hypothetical protein
MSNLHCDQDQREFFVWVDPNDFLARHQIEVVGSFFSVAPDNTAESLMFLPNPNFRGGVSPFHGGLLRQYIAEYNLELGRQNRFPSYPCRLQAMFLFETEDEAHRYRERHGLHVSSRILKRVLTAGPYIYSTHDSSWVDFLRLGHMIDLTSLENVCNAYWSGHPVQKCQLQSMGKLWTQESITEVLYLGRVEFPDRTLDAA